MRTLRRPAVSPPTLASGKGRAAQLVNEGDPVRRAKREAETREAAWALAALWHDPPDGDPARIETFLSERGVDASIRALRDRL